MFRKTMFAFLGVVAVFLMAPVLAESRLAGDVRQAAQAQVPAGPIFVIEGGGFNPPADQIPPRGGAPYQLYVKGHASRTGKDLMVKAVLDYWPAGDQCVNSGDKLWTITSTATKYAVWDMSSYGPDTRFHISVYGSADGGRTWSYQGGVPSY